MSLSDRDQVELSAKEFATQLNIPYFDTRTKIDVKSLADLITTEGMKAYHIVPLGVEGKKLIIGIDGETKRELLESLKTRLAEGGHEAEFHFVSQQGWQHLYNLLSIADNADLLDKGDFSGISKKLGEVEPKFMIEPLGQLAYQMNASDIHIEPAENDARVRFRIDGTLHPILKITKERYELLTSDLQIRANVKWGSDVPQGGRISVGIISNDGDEMSLNMRLETVPSLHGQDVVIRLFNLGTQYLQIEHLKLYPEQLKRLLEAVTNPQGLILAVGPTGSGKTSTLYSIMNHLNNDQVKIVSLEDPVEYELTGISQVPVRSDEQQLFMEKLRAVLREDPNVIMIGEIRDADTARTALQAALTGHMVLSTFHASSSAAAITRLIDMLGQNPLLASSIRLIIAQRLVRLLCNVCKLETKPTQSDILTIKAAFYGLPEDKTPKLTEKTKLFKAVGCDACHHFGYDGRIAIVEQMKMTPKLQDLIGRATAATTTQAIQKAAVDEGMVTLMQDAIRKVLEGKTTLEEIKANIGE